MTRREAGFTLIEALIAIVLLIVGLMAVTNLFIVAGNSNSVANRGTAATAIASRRMDVLNAEDFDDLAAAQGGNVDTACASPCQDAVVDVAPGAPHCQCVLIDGVGAIETRWAITVVNANTLFLRVRAEARGVLGPSRTRSEFTLMRCRNGA
jgi:type II secretory pathway component PulJ